MVPYSINPIEATANLAFAIGYSNLAKNGIYIAINGVAQHYSKVIKNRQIGKFELI
jgi:L-asparaginase